MTLIARLFIGLVGLIYLGLAIWYSVQPNVTSKNVGFNLHIGWPLGMSDSSRLR